MSKEYLAIPRHPGQKEPDITFVVVNGKSPGYQERIGRNILGTSSALGLVGSEIARIVDNMQLRDSIDVQIVDENRPRQKIDFTKRIIVLPSSFSVNAERTGEIIRECNRRDIPVMVGGIHASISVNTDYPIVDFAGLGAEVYVGEAANSKSFKGRIEHILKTGEFDKGKYTFCESFDEKTKEHIPGAGIDLADLPVDTKVHKQIDQNSMMYFVVPNMGCPWDCNFCSATFICGPEIRTRPPEDILKEVFLRDLPKSGFFLAADNILADEGEAYKLFELFARELYTPVGWTSETTLEALRKGGKDLMKLLAAAGCQKMWVGMESPDPKVLRAYHKLQNIRYCNPDNVKEITDMAHEEGIKVCAFYMAGSPAETPESIRMIPPHAKTSGFDEVNLNYFMLFPGTKLTNQMIKDGTYNPADENGHTDGFDFKTRAKFNYPMGNDVLEREYKRACKQMYSPREVYRRSSEAYKRAKKLGWPEKKFGSSFGSGFGFADMHMGGYALRAINAVLDPIQSIQEKTKEVFEESSAAIGQAEIFDATKS